jgi:hypothetical protein
VRRSFPQMHLIPVVVVWTETRVSMGCRLEYEWEWGQGLASFFPIGSMQPRIVERTHCPFYIRPHNIGTLIARKKRAVQESSGRPVDEVPVNCLREWFVGYPCSWFIILRE